MDVVLQNLVNGISIGAVYVIAAVGLALVFGVLDVPNFAHGQLYMIGAIAAYFLASSLSFGGGIIAAVILVGVLSVVLERLFFRPLRDIPAELTLVVAAGIAYVLEGAALYFLGPNKYYLNSSLSNVSWVVGNTAISANRLLVVVVAVVVVLALYGFMSHTDAGRKIRAVSENRGVAQLLGIDLNRMYLIAFAIGGFTAGLAGALNAGVFPSSANMGMGITLKSFVVVIMAGSNIGMTIVVSLLLGIVEVLGSTYISPSARDLFAFGILVVYLLIRGEYVRRNQGMRGYESA